MNLVVDIGNSATKIGVFEGSSLRNVFLITSKASLNTIKNYISQYKEIKKAIVSTVVDVDPEIIKYLKEQYHFTELGPDTPLPITNKYESPETLGNDRLAAAVAAATLFPRNYVLVVDCGTCIKYDLINRREEYKGGGISPGLDMRFKALHNFTGRLPLVSQKDTFPLIGKTTEESILSGVMNGTVCEVKAMVLEYKKKYPDLEVILSGGDARFFEKHIGMSVFTEPQLVLKGLNAILNHNSENAS